RTHYVRIAAQRLHVPQRCNRGEGLALQTVGHLRTLSMNPEIREIACPIGGSASALPESPSRSNESESKRHDGCISKRSERPCSGSSRPSSSQPRRAPPTCWS